MRNITEEERLHFDRRGVVHPPGLVADEWLGRLQAAFAEEMSTDQTRVHFVDFKALTPLPGSSLPQLPDIEGTTGEYDIVHYPAPPGDVIVHDANTVHGRHRQLGSSGPPGGLPSLPRAPAGDPGRGRVSCS